MTSAIVFPDMTGFAQPTSNTGSWTLAHSLHEKLGGSISAAAGSSYLDLRSGLAPLYEILVSSEEKYYPDDWLVERGLFVPPFQCSVDDRGTFSFWLAGISAQEVARIDVLNSP